MERTGFLRSGGAARDCRGIPQPGSAASRAPRSGASLLDLERAPLALRAVLYPRRIIWLFGFRHGGSRTHHRAGAVVELAAGLAPACRGRPPPQRFRRKDCPRFAGGHRTSPLRRGYGCHRRFSATSGSAREVDRHRRAHRRRRGRTSPLGACGHPGHRHRSGARFPHPHPAADGACLARRSRVHGSHRAARDFSDARRRHLSPPAAGVAGDAAGITQRRFPDIARGNGSHPVDAAHPHHPLDAPAASAAVLSRARRRGRHFRDDLSLYVPIPGHRERYVRIAGEPHRRRAAAGRPPPSGRRQRGSAAGQNPPGERRSAHGYAGARFSRRDSPARRVANAPERLAAAGGLRGRGHAGGVAGTMTELAFDVREVSYHYNQVTALNRLSMQVQRGERVALLGANGSGKSTLLRLLAGLCFPEHGEISFLGESLTEQRLQDEEFFFRFRRRVGLVFQNADVQLFSPSVFDELAFGPLQLRWPARKIRDRVGEVLLAMDIAHLQDRAPHRLSGGEKKRVALASVLVLDPEVLLLDEPSGALDPSSQARIVDFLVSCGNGSKTVITSTHDMDTLEDIADRCYVFANGRVAGEGTPLDILHDVALLERAKMILDPSSQSRIVDFLVSCGNGSKTVITSTHDMDTLEDIADRCYVLQRIHIVR